MAQLQITEPEENRMSLTNRMPLTLSKFSIPCQFLNCQYIISKQTSLRQLSLIKWMPSVLQLPILSRTFEFENFCYNQKNYFKRGPTHEVILTIL